MGRWRHRQSASGPQEVRSSPMTFNATVETRPGVRPGQRVLSTPANGDWQPPQPHRRLPLVLVGGDRRRRVQLWSMSRLSGPILSSSTGSTTSRRWSPAMPPVLVITKVALGLPDGGWGLVAEQTAGRDSGNEDRHERAAERSHRQAPGARARRGHGGMMARPHLRRPTIRLEARGRPADGRSDCPAVRSGTDWGRNRCGPAATGSGFGVRPTDQ